MDTGIGDMFLKVEGARHGLIKGEAHDEAHKDEIQIVHWSWGMQGRPSLGGGAATGKAVVNDLKVVKRVDSASTALMSALRQNEKVKAILTVRKAGGSQLEYFKITIEEGRVTALSIEPGALSSSSPELLEHLSFSFNKITVDYVPQGTDGRARGGMTYRDQWGDT
jgi:type VI secretion system secreted protein Hcp